MLFLCVMVVNKNILRNVELGQVLIDFLLLELVLAVISHGANTVRYEAQNRGGPAEAG